MILLSYNGIRSEVEWMCGFAEPSVRGTGAFLKNARVGLKVTPTGLRVDRNINGRCSRYFEVSLEGCEGTFLVPFRILGHAAFHECTIAHLDVTLTTVKRPDMPDYEIPVLSGVIFYK